MAIPETTPVPLVASQVSASLYLGGSEYVKNAMIYCLRLAFAHPYTPDEYRYDSVESKRQIAIYRGSAKRVAHFPCVIVETSEGNASITSLGNEEGEDRYNDDNTEVLGRTYWGTLSMPTKLTVYADTPTDRERLGDLLYIYVRSVFKDLFNRERMPFLGIRSGASGEEAIGGRVRYTYTISLDIQTEFNYFIDQSLLDIFKTVNMQGVLFGTDTTDLQPDTV